MRRDKAYHAVGALREHQARGGIVDEPLDVAPGRLLGARVFELAQEGRHTLCVLDPGLANDQLHRRNAKGAPPTITIRCMSHSVRLRPAPTARPLRCGERCVRRREPSGLSAEPRALRSRAPSARSSECCIASMSPGASKAEKASSVYSDPPMDPPWVLRRVFKTSERPLTSVITSDAR